MTARLLPLTCAFVVACATTPAPPPPVVEVPPPTPPKPVVLEPLPGAPIFLEAALTPDIAVSRARDRLVANNFRSTSFVRPPRSTAIGARDLALSAPRTGDLENVVCSGHLETVQIAAEPSAMGAQLQVLCYLDTLSGDGSCRHALSLGCPGGGDRLVAEIAMDAVGVQ